MVLCMYLTSLVGSVFTLFNQTFDHLASPSIEFSAAQWKRLCCDAELKGLRFDSSRRLGFFLRYSSWQHQYFFLYSFDLPLRLDLLHDGERLVYVNSLEIFLEERSSYAALFSFTFLSFTLHHVHYFLPPLWAYLSWRVASLQKYTLAYHRRILKKRPLFSLWCIGQILAQFDMKLEGFSVSGDGFGRRRLLKLVDWRSRLICKYALIMRARSIVEEMSIFFISDYFQPHAQRAIISTVV